MSRTTRRHESVSKRAKRGPKVKKTENYPSLKTQKQSRTSDRVDIRREYLP